MTLNYTVSKEIENMPLKNYLRSRCGVSMGMWRRIKWNSTIKINDAIVKATMAQVSADDIISCIVPEASRLEPVRHPLDVRYEDEQMIILNKPANMLVHPTAGDYKGTLGNALMYYYKETSQDLDFHPVHRLDRNTTGLVLVAKLPQLQHKLTQGGKFFHRGYMAIIPGRLDNQDGIIDLPIARHPDSIIQRICLPDSSGKTAITHYRTLMYSPTKNISLLWLELETGRTHQIRVHLAALGHPLLGDDLYGGSTKLIQRQALHAAQISIDNPLNGQHISVFCEPPKDFQQILF